MNKRERKLSSHTKRTHVQLSRITVTASKRENTASANIDKDRKEKKTTMAIPSGTSQKELIRLAALRNCEGASFLAEEELEEAIASFTVAYHCIGRALRDDDGAANDGNDNDDDDDDDDGSDDDDDKSTVIPAESVDKYHFILDTTDVAWYAASRRQTDDAPIALAPQPPECCFVYSEALVFNPESASDPQETPFFEAVILFNMAVTFHQHGRIRQSPGSSAAVAVAAAPAPAPASSDDAIRGLMCYNQCLKRLKEGNYDHSTQANHANMVVEAHMLIACLNNKVQVLIELGDYHEAFWILQEFGSVLTSTAGDPPGFEAAEVHGLEGTLELLNTPEFTAVHESTMAARRAAAAAATPAAK